MRQFVFTVLLLFATLAGGQSFDPSASNGSACVAAGIPSYCTAGFAGLSTDPANTNAQTQLVDPPAAAYSTIDLNTYLYPGNNTEFLVHWQPWWGCSGHISGIGYNENQTATVTGQMLAMKALGIDVVVPDYYGSNSARSCNLASVNAMASVIASNPSIYPRMMLGMDQGAFNNSGQCPPGSGITTAQMEACIENEFDYGAVHYFFQSWYETEAGKPIVTIFVDETKWPSVDFDTVWPHVHAHVAQGASCGTGCTYTQQVLILGRNSGSITRTGLDGSFAWSPAVQFSNASPSTQLLWNGSAGYLDNFYSVARANPTKTVIGLLEVGFDDSIPGSFGTGKIIARQCGQVLKFSADKVASSGYSSSSQLKRIQLQTWNDYEEGTEMESGVDACATLSASVVGTNLNWTLTPTDATYFNLSTLDHLRVVYGSGNSYTILTDNIAMGTSGSSSLILVPPGSWTIKIQAVGRPLIRNVLSNPVSFTVNVPPAPATGLFATVSQSRFKCSLNCLYGQLRVPYDASTASSFAY